MDEYNAYGKSTEHFLTDEPDEQKEERTKEQGEVFNELPILQKVISSLEDSITFHASTDSISDDVLVNPEEFMHVVAGNKQAIAVLKAEIIKLKSLVKEHTEQ